MRFPLRLLLAICACAASAQTGPQPRIEEMKGKTVLLFTPHPDDDAFCCAGTVAQLAAKGNRVFVVIYTNDDKGSYDLEMTSERLARIRKAEEEAGNAVIGVPKENLLWLGHHDGMLEYVDSRRLVEQATEIIRRYRPDLVLLPDPGAEYVRWHKTDHRMAAMNTMDAIRAAEWHLYFPNQRLQMGLEPWRVPAYLFYYVTPRDANYWVNIDRVLDKKLEASLSHVSQFEPAVHKYRPDWRPEDRAKALAELKSMLSHRDGHTVEAFRYATEFNQF
ncbi:MAG: PIG-L deacetylase family protein [Bryobacteraceae bacterium]|jgi:LmbE family N-acetylglucosaminyl deacetylase